LTRWKKRKPNESKTSKPCAKNPDAKTKKLTLEQFEERNEKLKTAIQKTFGKPSNVIATSSMIHVQTPDNSAAMER
jgi:hypothetical protein